ncbi:MAG TPA: hypothetical protein VFW66_04150 [Gemmatimonadales bacterium]|nr:hypothetical protein [Gemmatimonadales bacterium]
MLYQLSYAPDDRGPVLRTGVYARRSRASNVPRRRPNLKLTHPIDPSLPAIDRYVPLHR